MQSKNVLNILEAQSFFINSSVKVGKITFASYLINSLFKEKVIIFTPQESFLFKRRFEILSKQFIPLAKIKDSVQTYYLKENWHGLKQNYGLSFFLQEIESIVKSSEQKVILFHRFAEYFEFQDRYEIENIYKSLIKIATANDKKIIFSTNTQHVNYEYIHNAAEEFSDVTINIRENENHERLIDIKDIAHNYEYPLMNFKINKNTFLLDYYDAHELEKTRPRNILIAKLDDIENNLDDLCSYIFNKPNFILKHANSLATILQEIFIMPDVIVILMKRNMQNFDTIKAIRQQLPNTPIVTILDQDFVRAEDAQEAYSYGCDDLFSNNLSLENLILSFQKNSKTFFYNDEMKTLPQLPNIAPDFNSLKEFANACLEKSIFFSAFVFNTNHDTKKVTQISRKHDYIYQTDEKLYYLALNTRLKDAKSILKAYSNYEVLCTWEPLNNTDLTGCFQ